MQPSWAAWGNSIPVASVVQVDHRLIRGVGAFFDDMSWCSGQQWKTFGEDIFLESRLVSLDGHHVVEAPFGVQVLCGVVLGVRGVEGDDDALGCLHRDTRQERVELGDFIGAVGHPDLRDGATPAVDHRGEQGDLTIVGGPGAAEDLAVQCDHQQALGVPVGPFEGPRSDQQVQLSGVDALQHPSQCRFARPVVSVLEPVPARAPCPEQRLWKISNLRRYLTIV
jgi:hypothetical protein